MKKVIYSLSIALSVVFLSGCGEEINISNDEITQKNIKPQNISRTVFEQFNLGELRVTNDDKSVIFNVKGKASHRLIFVDGDRDASTGYTSFENENIGAEYLIENQHKFKYIGKGGTHWLWEYAGTVDAKISETNYFSKVSFDFFGKNVTNFNVVAGLLDENWGPISASSEQVFTKVIDSTNRLKKLGSNKYTDFYASNDSLNIYFKNKTHNSIKNQLYYISTDSSKKTGYGYMGAEYLVENNILYKYIGDGSSWSWERIDKLSQIIEKDTEFVIVPKKLLSNLQKLIRVTNLGVDKNWKEIYEFYNKVYVLSDGGGDIDEPFIFKVKTDKQFEITINNMNKNGYNYNVDCDSDGRNEATGVTSSYLCNYDESGEYVISITRDFPQIYFAGSDAAKVISIEQWSKRAWRSMYRAFEGCSNVKFNAKDKPNLSKVTDMSGMFVRATGFNEDISDWDVSNVTNMNAVFYRAGGFNQDISGWDVSNVTNMAGMFVKAYAFNQDISDWDVSNVTNMESMFNMAVGFKQDIGNWDVSKVTNMSRMFYRTDFNQDISSWDVSNVTNMAGIFHKAGSFNQDISSWDVSNVTNMGNMFMYAMDFNQDITNWNVGKVTNMRSMFKKAESFNQDISNWNVSSVISMDDMFTRAKVFSTSNYDKLLNGWSRLQLEPGVNFGVGNIKYSSASSKARQKIIDKFQWKIIDGGQE